jgi:hypothetical protein
LTNLSLAPSFDGCECDNCNCECNYDCSDRVFNEWLNEERTCRLSLFSCVLSLCHSPSSFFVFVFHVMSVALRAAVAGSLVASVLLSWALWSDAHRTPDLVPLFPFFSGACFLSSLFPLLHVAALLLLLSLVVAPRPSLLAAFLAGTFSCLLRFFP